MSRKSLRNQYYEFVYGLDHAVGPFFQVYERRRPVIRDGDDIDDDGLLIDADRLGFFVKPNKDIGKFKSAYCDSPKWPGVSSEIITKFARLCGFDLAQSDVVKILEPN